jgi:hypothetical protein
MKLMKIKTSGLAILMMLAVALVATSSLVAQGPPPPPPHNMPMMPGPMGGPMGGELGDGKTVTGAPLSGTLIVTRDTTLGDGNKIHNESEAKVYRDTEGRVRREMGVDLVTPATGAVKRNFIVITDPVAGNRYMLNPDNKTARQMPLHGGRHAGDNHQEDHMKAMGGPGGAAEFNKEQLGTKAVNGVQAEGIRVSRTIPAGTMGNEKAIVVVTERWYSPDLQIAVMTVHTDPMMGTVTTKLVNVTRGEPDASLFQVPSDYAMEAGKPGDPMYVPMKP